MKYLYKRIAVYTGCLLFLCSCGTTSEIDESLPYDINTMIQMTTDKQSELSEYHSEIETAAASSINEPESTSESVAGTGAADTDLTCETEDTEVYEDTYTEADDEAAAETTELSEEVFSSYILTEIYDEAATEMTGLFEEEVTYSYVLTEIEADVIRENKIIEWDESLEYADYSKIHDDTVTLYYSHSDAPKGKIIAINAGHGTYGGEREKTLCHPDGTAKYVSGSTAAGNVYSASISSGMEFPDGTPEGKMTFLVASSVKELLLDNGYDVLMLRNDDDCRLDNIARTVIANNNADCHISIHFDSSTTDKGAFFIGVPDIEAYRSMEPVASHWKEHTRLGESLINGMQKNGLPVYGNGRMDIDLTQTSFSTIPSVDLEIGDKGTDITDDFVNTAAYSILDGVNEFFGFD